MVTENKQLKKLTTDEIRSLLEATKTQLSTVSETDFNDNGVQSVLNTLLETTGQKPGILFSLIRLAVSWAPFSPALNETLAVLGKDETIARIDTALASL
jgi:glutamyl-tRNA synthetase